MAGLLATFASEAALEAAIDRFPRGEWPGVDTYSPVPIQAQTRHSVLPGLMCGAGILSFIGFFLLMAYADMRAYPHNIGGRPAFAWPAFIPIAFELAVLCAMVVGFFGYFVVCRMPQFYLPLDQCEGSGRALYDRWLLSVPSDDPRRLHEARAIFQSLGAENIEEFT